MTDPAVKQRGRLIAFYAKYNPDKLATVDDALAKFAGTEDTVMWPTLISKYGPEPPMDYRARLVRFYQSHNPEKLANVDQALSSFKGKEEEMFTALVLKYGPEPLPTTTTTAAPTATAASAAPPAAAAPAENPHRARLVAYYQQYNPDKLGSVDATLAKFAGREEEMFEALVAKYGPEPGAQRAAVPPSAPAAAGSSYRARLVAFYTKYNPDKLPTVDATLAKFAGREEEMFEALIAFDTKYEIPSAVPTVERAGAQRLSEAKRHTNQAEDEKKIASGEEQQTYTIRFMDGSRKKVEAFRSDTIMDLILRVCTMLSIRQGEHLFYLAHSVNENSVLGAVDRFLDKGKTIEAEGINPKCNLVFKFKHYKRHRKWSDGNAQEWFFKQIHRNVITEYYPTTEKLAVELASYELQSVHGDATGKEHPANDKIGLDSYLPVSILTAHDYEYWQERLQNGQKKCAGLSAIEARSRYVETFASCSGYWGMTFFDVRDKENQPYLAGIAEDGLYLFSASKKELLLSLPFGKLAGWERSPSGIFIKQRGASKMTLFASSKLQSKEMCDLLNEYYTMLPQQVRETLGTVIENQEELRSKLPGSEVFQMPQVDRKRPVEFYSRLEFLKYAYLDQCHRNGLDGVPQQPIKKFTQAMDKALDEGRPFEILDLSNTDVDDAQIAIIRELFFYTMDQLHATDTDQFEENVAPTTISVAHAEKNARLTEHCAANLFDLMAKFSVNITSVNLSSIPLDRTETDLGNTLVAMKNLQVLVLKSCKLKTKTFIAVMQVFSIVPSKLHTLDVEHNDLTEASVSQLCNYIESSNCALTNLNISHNRVDASGLESIITTVKRQQRLKVLNYAGNAAVPASKLADLVAARAGITDLDISFLHLSGEGAVRITEELRGKGQLAKLNLSNNPIGKTLRRELNAGNGEVNRDLPAAFVAFLDVSSYSDVKVLTLDECELHEDAGLALAGVLQSNTKLAELYLNKNNLAAKTGMLPGAWTDMLPVNQTLQKLHLSYNNIQYPGLKAIFQAMTRNQGITELKLDGNNFDRYPVNTPHTEIVNFFEANQTVQTLSICNMFIKDDVLRKIGEGLRKNRGLRTLLAFSNEVTYQGVVDFARCLPENTTLESLDLSCHSVQSSEDLYLQAYKMLIDQSNLESVLL